MSSAIVTYLIPVYNQVHTIGRAIESAQRALDLFDGKLLVCVNKCTDDTLAVAEEFSNSTTRIIASDVYLSALDNTERGLCEIDTPYLCFLSGDDFLDLDGQSSIFNRAVLSTDSTGYCIFYGDYMKVFASGGNAGLATLDRSWHSGALFDAKVNIINIHLPNLNGAWIPTAAFRAALEQSKRYIPPAYFSNAWDVPMWWCLCHIVKFIYIQTIQVNYTIDDVSTKTSDYTKADQFNQINGIFNFYEHITREFSADDKILAKKIYRRKLRFLLECRGVDYDQLQIIHARFPAKDNQITLRFHRLLATNFFSCLSFIRFCIRGFYFVKSKISGYLFTITNLLKVFI